MDQQPAAALTAISALSGSLSQRVYLSLRKAILTLALPPGTILRKSQIAEEFGISRQPVSEAIARLATDGLLDVVPQSGTRVSRLSSEAIAEALFLREALESAAVRKVALERSEEQLARLTRNIRLQHLLAEDDDQPGFYEADEAFHAMLMECTGFQGLTATVASVSLILQRARRLVLPAPGRSRAAFGEHAAIVEAIRAGDPDRAEQAMRHHLGHLASQMALLKQTYPEYFGARSS